MRTKHNLDKKTYGRIFVRNEEEVAKVKEIIETFDPFEAEYLPEDFITVWGGDITDTVYGHKFEIDALGLTQVCLDQGIWPIIVTGIHTDWWTVDRGGFETDTE